jgi:type I restriction enzyme M protein
MAKKAAKKETTGANIGFEAKLWLAADKLRSNMDASEYKHVVLGLIFLKYISDTFDEHHAKLVEGKGQYDGANPEDPDEYKAENVFWVPQEARWTHLQAHAKQPTIGKLVDDAMVAIERDSLRLKGVLPKDYARPALDKHRLGELIDLVGTIGLGDKENRAKDILGRVYEYFLTQFASAEGKNGGQFYTPSCECWWKCWHRTRVASMTRAADRAGCLCSRKSSSKRTGARSATSASTVRKAIPQRDAWP